MAINVVTPAYFEVLRIPLVAGRAFDERDAGDAPPVIMVNEAAARLLWPDGPALGGRARITFDRTHATVVGVVGQTLYHDLATRDEPYAFYPFAQLTGPALASGHFLARGDKGVGPALEALRAAIRDVDATLPVDAARAVHDQLGGVMATQRFGAALLGLFSALAVLITAIGVYGVAAWAVAARRREIGIRMALGADASRILTGVLGGTGSATAAGAALGLVAAAGLTRLLESFLYQVAPLDPAAFTAALASLALVATLAAWLPGRRAVRVDPADTMRTE
jgi:hypothetical protein